MVSLNELTAGLPQPLPITAEDVRLAAQARPGEVLVVLDDDPTGTQSIAGLPVLTAWADEDFRWAYAQGSPAVYVMTNSRSLPPDAAADITEEIVSVALRVAAEAGLRPVLVSRSDSTLRGHFPLDTDVMQRLIDGPSGVVLVPAFPEAGRITVGGVHYCRQGTDYVPAGDSEFARDATFGYESSDLRGWVCEKSAGAIAPEDVVVIGLAQLRTDPDAVSDAVMRLDGRVLVCDIAAEEDLRALSLALIAAEQAGKRFVYRVGPPFVRARIGQETRVPLTSAEVIEASRQALGSRRPATSPGGLVVVGSHVDVTQRQLAHLTRDTSAEILEIEVSRVVDGPDSDAYLQELIEAGARALREGSVIVQTSRRLVTSSDADASLALSRAVSAAVVSVVRGIVERTAPRFVLAKGGITSSDVAAKALGIRHAIAVGPMLPGIVSLWVAQDGPAVGLPYVVFPGNVGDETSLSAVVAVLEGTAAGA